MTCGVPQGSLLGPLLFLLYLNEVVDHIKDCKLIHYADDTVLYTGGKSTLKPSYQLTSTVYSSGAPTVNYYLI